ncbi:MAG: hypothetical protein IT293_04360 [Deltaproteobacteria bacterium]|nr:hypothetical protein [Deltaproteobacteria bacterium]
MLLGVALGNAVGVRPADATMVASMSTATQATAADRIFVGTVASVLSRRKASHPRYFETVVRFTVEETVAGAIPANVELAYSGGEVDGIRQRVDGMPELAVGERYVVLLEPEQSPPLASPFVGFNQGLYRVVGESRASAVVRDRAGHALTSDALPAGSRGAGGDPALDAFLDTLRAARK